MTSFLTGLTGSNLKMAAIMEVSKLYKLLCMFIAYSMYFLSFERSELDGK